MIERKRAEDALQRSEALLTEGQRISQTGSWTWCVTTDEIIWSEEHCRIFGFSGDHKNVNLATYFQTVHPSDAARVHAVLDDALRRACEFSIEYRIILSDRTMKHIHSRGRPVVGNAGKVEEFIGTAMDISYRYEAKLALENALAESLESEDQLRKLIDTMPGYAWTAGPNGETEFLSQGWLEFAGMSLKEAQGAGWANAIHPDDVGLMIEKWQKIVASKKAGELEARMRRFDGEYRWVLFRGAPLLDQRGHVVKWYGVNIDIEDQKHSEEEMRKLVALIENSSDCIGYAKSPTEIAYINAAWRKFAGLDADEDLANYQMADFLPAEEYQRFQDEILPILGRDGHWEGERVLHNIKTKVGVPFHQTIFFITEAGTDRRIGIATVYRNIAEQKRAEHELRMSEAALRKAEIDLAHVTRLTTMGELTASIAHEVNQPLTGIVMGGNAGLRWLDRDSPNLDEAREAIRRVVQEGKRAGAVIARIRRLFKKDEPVKEQLNINEIIEEVVVLTRNELQQHSIMQHLSLTPDLSPIFGDRVQIQQVLMNLILNAIDAMNAVEVGRRELVIRTFTSRDNETTIEVRDTGVGVDPQEAERIFETFHTTKPGGMGMGLAISKSIVQSHGGRLQLVAQKGPGASFRFTIPTSS